MPENLELTSGHQGIVKLLLEAVADVNANSEGCHNATTLQVAAQRGFSEGVHQLLCAGATVNPAVCEGLVPLQKVARKRDLSILDLPSNS